MADAGGLPLAATIASAVWLIWHLTSDEAPSQFVTYLLVLKAFSAHGLVAGVQRVHGEMDCAFHHLVSTHVTILFAFFKKTPFDCI